MRRIRLAAAQSFCIILLLAVVGAIVGELHDWNTPAPESDVAKGARIHSGQ